MSTPPQIQLPQTQEFKNISELLGHIEYAFLTLQSMSNLENPKKMTPLFPLQVEDEDTMESYNDIFAEIMFTSFVKSIHSIGDFFAQVVNEKLSLNLSIEKVMLNTDFIKLCRKSQPQVAIQLENIKNDDFFKELNDLSNAMKHKFLVKTDSESFLYDTIGAPDDNHHHRYFVNSYMVSSTANASGSQPFSYYLEKYQLFRINHIDTFLHQFAVST